MKRTISAALGLVLTAATGLLAQTPAPPKAPAGQATVETDPIDCWWRTSSTSVRVGEAFTFVLTCSVVESDAVKVVPDQSALEPAVVQMQPFEVIGGAHGPDLRSGDRRFFQYEYRLRLIGEDLFGKDVTLPALKLTYKVQSKVGQGESVQGRDLFYLLPSESIRVLSLVPASATAIRDAGSESFADIDAREFRANAMRVGGGILFGLAALLGVQILVAAAGRYRVRAPVARSLVGDGAILRTVGKELSEIERERQGTGWTPELAGRALAATRIAASYALQRPVNQALAGSTDSLNGSGYEGALSVRSGWIRGKDVFVAGSVTAEGVHQASRASSLTNGAGALDDVGKAMRDLSFAWYARDHKLDDSALDDSLSSSRRLQGQMARQNSWIAKRVTAIKRVVTRGANA